MAEPRKEIRQVSTQVNDEEASYLQGLGLKTLLEDKLRHPMKRFWSEIVCVQSCAWPFVAMFFALLCLATAVVAIFDAREAGEKKLQQLAQAPKEINPDSSSIVKQVSNLSDVNAQTPTGRTALHIQRGESPPSAQPIKEWFQPGLIKKLPIPSNWKRRN